MDKQTLMINPAIFNAVEVAPLPGPPSATPNSIPSEPRKSPSTGVLRWTWMVIAGAIFLLLIVSIARLVNRKTAGRTNQGLRTAIVERKDFVRNVRVHGTVEAVESMMLAVPRLSGQGLNTLLITHLVKNGSTIHTGDVLVEFDRQAQLKNVLDKEAEYKGLVAQIEKKSAEQSSLRAADETEVKKAEDALKTAELEVKKNEIVSRIDAEKNLQDLLQARATYQELTQTFALKRQAAEAELRILEIQRDRALTAMKWAEGNTKKMLVRSSMDGVAVINSMWKGGSMSDVQEGDEVRAGFPFMQVVNPQHMRVRARVNQADIGAIRIGLPVQIGLDAYPELSFQGRVDTIAAVAQTSGFSEKLRNVIVIFSIQGTDPKLLPDLSSAVDIELDRKPDQLVASRDAVFIANGKTLVRVKTGSAWEDREIKAGPANDTEQVIKAGIEKGAVVLRNPNQ